MTTITTAGTPGVNRFSRSQLLRTARLFATDPDLRELVDLAATERTWHRLDATDHLEIWVVGWPVGSSTGWHDHLQSEGAILTVAGELAEQTWSAGEAHDRYLWEGEGRSFGPRHVHNVTNLGDRPALSVHVYSPALRGMTRYALLDGRLRQTGIERAGAQW
ncbi:cysteine dioxygenase family protein [Nostocoides sp. HKS02]|uniref:cysteine dioxygenase n=1 Tax=Nostocoides sp. HKS02 TaxID=1813880 RepID=UPI0012B4B460|nr:cysteine dioxygenase family protein [Tetrasphaera sp. HKS02]QGN56848.1 cysteine dioxygenase [Tetrasphaera sp. HKS02]